MGVVLLLAACGAPRSVAAPGSPDAAIRAEPEQVIEIAAFTDIEDADDPFTSLAPDHVRCPAPAYVIEADPAGFSTLEVRTDVCNYLTLQTPSQVAIRRGDTLRLLMWHNTLLTAESAQAYAAIQIDGALVWSIDVPIPSPAHSYAASWRAEANVPAGRPVLFHVHNHGANAWRFGDLTVEPGD
jgi:hypothetical protein